METAVTLIKDIGFPLFVAVFVLVRLEPSIKRLEQSITTLMVVTAKSNGMKRDTVEEIITKVIDRKSGHRRRSTDMFDD